MMEGRVIENITLVEAGQILLFTLPWGYRPSQGVQEGEGAAVLPPRDFS